MMQGTEALKTLYTALIDARTGYVKAVEKAPDESQRAIFKQGEQLHERARSVVNHLLISRGERPDESGSFMSTVNKAVVSVRAAVTGLNDNSLEAFARGDEVILKRFAEAVEANSGDLPTLQVLRPHRDALGDFVAKLTAHAG